jgi:hypothetical protein
MANRTADQSQVRGREACHSEDQQLDRELAWKDRTWEVVMALLKIDSEVKNRDRARARSVGIVRRNKAQIFSHHFVALA